MKIFRVTVRLNTLRAMTKSATKPDTLATKQAARYGSAERKPFWTDTHSRVGTLEHLTEPTVKHKWEKEMDPALTDLRSKCRMLSM